jgi:hypothetical protein
MSWTSLARVMHRIAPAITLRNRHPHSGQDAADRGARARGGLAALSLEHHLSDTCHLPTVTSMALYLGRIKAVALGGALFLWTAPGFVDS